MTYCLQEQVQGTHLDNINLGLAKNVVLAQRFGGLSNDLRIAVIRFIHRLEVVSRVTVYQVRCWPGAR